ASHAAQGGLSSVTAMRRHPELGTARCSATIPEFILSCRIIVGIGIRQSVRDMRPLVHMKGVIGDADHWGMVDWSRDRKAVPFAPVCADDRADPHGYDTAGRHAAYTQHPTIGHRYSPIRFRR